MAMSRPRYARKRSRLRKTRFKQGTYIPVNEDKYRRAVDKYMNGGRYPFYRSSWELKFYKYCDMSENVEYWGSEILSIPYISPKDGQVHRYFPDVFVKTKDGRKFIIEIKPEKQRNNPINRAKWESARNYAKRIGAEFIVLSEKELKSMGLI